jgi:hypothetical protein
MLLLAAPDPKVYRAVSFKVRSRREPIGHSMERLSVDRFQDIARP